MSTHEEALKLMMEHANKHGRLIEVGWYGLQLACIPPNAPQVQLDEMRSAFFAGAQHLFSSIFCLLDPGQEITEGDLHRMDLIDRELRTFLAEFEKKHGLTGKMQ